MRTCSLLAILVITAALPAATVDGFSLINADSNGVIGPLDDGATLDLGSLPTTNLSVRANVSGTPGTNVVFSLSGAESHSQSEGVAPYALFGDSSGNYDPWTPSLGSYSLSATVDGTTTSIGFTVEDGGSTEPPPSSGDDGDGSVTISGERRRWHKVTLDLDGPWAAEGGSPNPFTDYRMTVTFSNGSLSYQVPGYFAADGNAANSSATSGTTWRAHLSPDLTGTWSYSVDFRYGSNVAVNGGGSELAPYDGKSGTFSVSETDKSGRDFRAKGRLEYVGEHYLRFAGSGEYFLKQGPDAPENLLAYEDFDGDFKSDGVSDNRIKSWSAHAGDWTSGDPSWQGGKGTELVGALNYLASEGLNAFSFLTMNINGDDKNVFPYTGYNERLRMDVSRLGQWEILFEHATRKGLYLHFKTQETENDQLLDGGALGTQRKLYYRELIARFSHHLALNWNLGEENTNTESERKAFAQYFWDNDPYRHNIVLHTYPGQKGSVYTPLLGSASKLTGLSLQTNRSDFANVHGDVRTWVQNSANAGKKWVVACDEPGDASAALRPDDNAGSSHRDGRVNALWGTFLAGGAGNEWYFGYQYAHSDLTCEDFRSRDAWWDYCRYALGFFRDHNIPVVQMGSADALTSASGAHCFAQAGQVYVIMLPNGGSTNLDLNGTSGSYSVKWFDPRNGGSLKNGSVTSVSGGGNRSLGNPPSSSGSDWVILVTKSGTTPANQAPDAQASATPTSGDASLTVSFSSSGSSDSDGSIVSRSWSFGDGGSSTDANPNHTYSSAGTYTATLTVTDDDGASDSDSVTITVEDPTPVGQSPYGGSPLAIAASGVTRLQAEDYDLGGAGVAYSDTTGGNSGSTYRSDDVDIQSTSDTGGGANVGWVAGGEWLEYTIDVVAAGTYQVELRVARQPSGNVDCHLEVGGANLSGAIPVPSTGGWQTWTTIDAEVDLAAGQQVLRLAFDGSSVNINWLEFSLVQPPQPTQSPYGGSPVAVGSGTARIEAENYDLGGADVAYSDRDSSNQGGAYRDDQVDIQSSGDIGGGYNVGWIAGGEWLEYTIDVAAAGTYEVDLRVARSPSGSSSLHLEVGGSDLSGSVAVPNTGGWQSYTTITTEIDLVAGQQVLRVAMDGSSFNLNWLELTPVGSSVGTVVAAINAAGGAYTAGDGTSYSADTAFSGGSTYSTGNAIAGTADEALYQSERYGTFSYAIPVPNGDYLLTLQFAEVYFTADGQRVFDVIAEGTEVVSNLDIHAVAGHDVAYDVVVPVSVSDGMLDIGVSADVNNPKLSAILVETAAAANN